MINFCDMCVHLYAYVRVYIYIYMYIHLHILNLTKCYDAHM